MNNDQLVQAMQVMVLGITKLAERVKAAEAQLQSDGLAELKDAIERSITAQEQTNSQMAILAREAQNSADLNSRQFNALIEALNRLQDAGQ